MKTILKKIILPILPKPIFPKISKNFQSSFNRNMLGYSNDTSFFKGYVSANHFEKLWGLPGTIIKEFSETSFEVV